MKMNFDCIRSVLLYLELNLKLDNNYSFSAIGVKKLFETPELSEYTREDIAYTVHIIDEVGFITTSGLSADDDPLYYPEILTLTYDGHVYLEQVRPITRWRQIKSHLSKVGFFSLDIVQQAATSLIAHSLGL